MDNRFDNVSKKTLEKGFTCQIMISEKKPMFHGILMDKGKIVNQMSGHTIDELIDVWLVGLLTTDDEPPVNDCVALMSVGNIKTIRLNRNNIRIKTDGKITNNHKKRFTY